MEGEDFIPLNDGQAMADRVRGRSSSSYDNSAGLVVRRPQGADDVQEKRSRAPSVYMSMTRGEYSDAPSRHRSNYGTAQTRYIDEPGYHDDDDDDDDHTYDNDDLNGELDALMDECSQTSKKKKEKTKKAMPKTLSNNKQLQLQSRELARQRNAYIAAIVKNSRHQRVQLKFWGDVGYWQVKCKDGKKRSFAGLTTMLSRLFWHEFAYDTKLGQVSNAVVDENGVEYFLHPCAARPDGGTIPRPDGQQELNEQRRRIASRCKSHGAEHGTEVHEEMARYTACFITHRDEVMDEFLRSFEEGDGPDQCTMRLIKCLKDNDWEPVASELHVFVEELGTATSFDLIVRARKLKDACIAIEIKTGYDGLPGSMSYIDGCDATPMMRGPLSHIRETPRNQFCLQLLTSQMLLVMGEKNELPPEQRAEAKIATPHYLNILHVRPSTDEVAIIGMQEWAKEPGLMQAIYDEIKNFNRLRVLTASMDTQGNSVPVRSVGRKRLLDS